MDAGRRNALPDDKGGRRQAGAHLESWSWMLPHLPPSTVARLRPDLLLVQGLSQTDVQTLALADPLVLRSLGRA
jgi:hypothetical protein